MLSADQAGSQQRQGVDALVVRTGLEGVQRVAGDTSAKAMGAEGPHRHRHETVEGAEKQKPTGHSLSPAVEMSGGLFAIGTIVAQLNEATPMQKITWIRRTVLLLVLAGSAAALRAETLALIPGYLGDGEGWRDSGVTRILQGHGWTDAGSVAVRQGWLQMWDGRPDAGRRFYTLSLESEAPLLYQEPQLSAMVELLQRRHPGENLILVGHSAGGVLGRLYMVRHPDAPVRALVSIASPHLGTDSAELGLMAGQSPQ